MALTLLCGCAGTTQGFFGNNTSIKGPVDTGTVPALQNQTNLANETPGVHNTFPGNVTTNQAKLEAAWKTLRVINTDTNERYLKLDLTKSEDINYLRYLLVPGTVRKIEQVRSELYLINPVNDEERGSTQTLIDITNYTILKYEGLSTVLHASQYVTIGDPVKMKAELRNAKFQIMDALDIINEREISQYPSLYRDQIAADKRELDDMASQVESFTRSVYLSTGV